MNTILSLLHVLLCLIPKKRREAGRVIIAQIREHLGELTKPVPVPVDPARFTVGVLVDHRLISTNTLGYQKIRVIKVTREVLSCGLVEAKKWTEKQLQHGQLEGTYAVLFYDLTLEQAKVAQRALLDNNLNPWMSINM
jgi:hypothetical protein